MLLSSYPKEFLFSETYHNLAHLATNTQSPSLAAQN